MADITAEILDEIPFSRFTSAAVIQRGKQYFREDRVYEIEFNGSAAYCLVEGSYEGDYEVNISLQSDQRVAQLLQLGDELLAEVARGVYGCTRYVEPTEAQND